MCLSVDMKAFILSAVLGLAVISPTFAWAILLNEPALFPIWKENSDTVKEVNAAMARLDFKGGVVFVSAPKPARNLRFGAPGQSVNELLPLLEKLGYKVTVAFSDSMKADWGFLIGQVEDGGKELAITINTKHKRFDRELLEVEGK